MTQMSQPPTEALALHRKYCQLKQRLMFWFDWNRRYTILLYMDTGAESVVKVSLDGLLCNPSVSALDCALFCPGILANSKP